MLLDLSEEIAGPYASKLLVDLGAEVIKAETPTGDRLRRWSATGEPFDPSRDGGLFDYLNASKRSMILDLETPRGRDEFLTAATRVDLVIEGNRGPFLSDLDIHFDDLHDRNPALSLATISWFGRTGPFRDVVATDFTVQAWCGSIAQRGPEHLPPVHVGGRITEWIGGAHAAAAALGARRSSRRGGEGRHLDLSLFEGAATSLVSYPTVFKSFAGLSEFGGRKLDIPSIHCGLDGWVGVCIVTGQQWLDLLVMVGRSDLLDDTELALWAGRSRRSDEVNGFVDAWMNVRTVAEILGEAQAFRIPAAPIGNGKTLLHFDHLAERGVFHRSASEAFVQPRAPFLFSSVPASTKASSRPASMAAAHTDASNAALGPLAGVRVLDLTAFVAGPMATLYLASMGADVLKVESIQRPDPIRYYSVTTPDDPEWYEKSPYFVSANLGKRAITLNLSHPRGMALLHKLIATADVVVENFTPRVVDEFGLTYELMRGLNPGVIFVRLPAFGLDGPWRDRGGFAQTMEQVSGLSWVTGHADGPPLVPGGFGDPLQAIHAALAMIAALEFRDGLGHGFQLEVPMVEVAINVTAEQVIEWSRNGVLLTRMGNRGPGAAPQGLYACGDGRLVALAVESNEQWSAVVATLALPPWAAALGTAAERRGRHDELDALLTQHFALRDPEEVVGNLLTHRVPTAPVDPGGQLDSHPQLLSRRFFEPIDQPVAGHHGFPGWPSGRASWGLPWFTGPSPLLGEDNDDVFRGELGLSDAEIADLEAELVVGRRPLGLA